MKKLSFLFIISIFLFSACTHEEPIKLAVSKLGPGDSYKHYEKWVHHIDSSILCINMYTLSLDSALAELENCSGLLVTGGPDVYPGRYGKAEDTVKCGAIDYWRDTLEIALIEKALEMGLPIMGICRGLQITNVALGGSLIVDIPTDYDTSVMHRCPDKYNCFHTVTIEAGSKFYWCTNLTYGSTNSNHHQGIDRLAPTLKYSARSTDGLIEAIEWADPMDKSFLMGVQWHPERMEYTDPLSHNIAEYFVSEVQNYKDVKRF